MPGRSYRLVVAILVGLTAFSISAQAAPRSRRQPPSGCRNPCPNRVLGDRPYLYTLTGDGTSYNRIDADCARYSIAWKDGRP